MDVISVTPDITADNVDEVISRLYAEMKWFEAVKKWNEHKRTVNTAHVWAVPRKGTTEHAEVKAISEGKPIAAPVAAPVATKPVPKKGMPMSAFTTAATTSFKPLPKVINKMVHHVNASAAPLPTPVENPKYDIREVSMGGAGKRPYSNVFLISGGGMKGQRDIVSMLHTLSLARKNDDADHVIKDTFDFYGIKSAPRGSGGKIPYVEKLLKMQLQQMLQQVD